jgi:chaperonin cofactor prefoldin
MKKENLEVLLEDISSKFDLVLEGHEVLRSEIRELGRKTDERFDLVDFKIDTLNKKIDAVDERLSKKIDAVDEKLSKKIDAVAVDLAAHRADTEAHHGMYRVKEG